MAKKMMNNRTLMKILAIMVALTIVANLGPVTTMAASRDGENSKEFSSSTVNHIDIGVKLTADIMIDGVLYENLSYTMEASDINSDSLSITSTGSHSYSLSSYSHSTGSSGISQFRISGTFPVGTINAPVYYTVKLTKTVSVTTNNGTVVSIPVTFSSTFHYWSGNNDCPGLDSNSSKWQQGSVIKDSGLDFTLGNGEGDTKTEGTLTVQKTLTGLALSEGESKTFFFDIYTADGKLYDTLSTAVSAASPYATASISDIPYGEYYVVERDASANGYTMTTTYQVGSATTTIRSATLELNEASSTQTVQVLNAYEKLPDPTGGLILNKTVSGLDMDKTFRFAVYTAAGELVKNASIFIENGQSTGSVTVTELPYGEYYIIETNAGVEGYTVATNFQVSDGTPTESRSSNFTIGENTQLINVNILNAYEEDIVNTAPSESEDTTPTTPTTPSEPEDTTPTNPTTPSEPEDTTPTNPTTPSEPEDTTPTIPLDPTGTITIQKTATGLGKGLVRTYTFHIYHADGSLFKTVAITGSGIANIYGVPYGSYYVTELDGSIENYDLNTTYRIGLNATTSGSSNVFTVGKDMEQITIQVVNTYTPTEPEDTTPTTPSTPSEPEDTTPTTPSTPSESEDTTPTTPSAPSESEDTTPTTPSTPSESEDTTPTTPSAPSESEDTTPTTPSTPSESEDTTPTTPSAPSESEDTTPTTPSTPSEPEDTTPTTPSAPSESEDTTPTTPSAPSESEDTTPTTPSEPEESNPTAPTWPEDPGIPIVPKASDPPEDVTDPTTEAPTDPVVTDPTEPSSTDSTVPGDPVHPSTPIHPGEPEQPSDPAHPDDPVASSESEETTATNPVPTEPEDTTVAEPASTTPVTSTPTYANVPYTGSTIGLWVTLSILSGSGAMLLSIPRRKDEEE